VNLLLEILHVLLNFGIFDLVCVDLLRKYLSALVELLEVVLEDSNFAPVLLETKQVPLLRPLHILPQQCFNLRHDLHLGLLAQ